MHTDQCVPISAADIIKTRRDSQMLGCRENFKIASMFPISEK